MSKNPLSLCQIFRRLLIVAALISPLTAVAEEPVRVVATGGRIANTFYPFTKGDTAFRQRTPHKLGGPVAEMQIGFMDWMYPTSTAETANTNDVTIDHAWLERAATGQIVPLTFSGNRALVLPANSTTPYWLSDKIPSAVWTGAAPAQDEVFWLHVKGTIPEAGGKIPVGTPTTFSGAKFITYPAANEPGTQDLGGAVPTITGSVARPIGLPLIFLGRFAVPGRLSVIGIGDSIMDGSGDSANPVPVISGFGFFNRAALDANGANAIAMFNLTRHGQTASSWMTPTRQSRQTHFLKFANVVAEEYGTNDIGGQGTGNTTNLLKNLEGIWTTARNEGVQKIVRTLLMPRTLSAADPTPSPGWGAGEKRDIVNAGLIAAKDAGKIDAIVDALAVLAGPTDNTRWISNGTSYYVTSDGTHVSAAGNALLAPHLRAALLSLTLDENTGYNTWSSGISWEGKDSSATADPNNDGISNLLAYALGIPPFGRTPTNSLPQATLDSTTTGGLFLALNYRQNTKATDLTYIIETSTDLITWTPAIPNGTTIIQETISSTVADNPDTALNRIRLKQAPGETHRFLRLRVKL